MPRASRLPAGAAQEGGHLASVDAKLPALGPNNKANSVPVTLASDQPAVPVSGTFYQVVQPVSGSLTISGTLPAFAATPTFNLGTLGGAATAAKQPALGVAGTASSDVVTVQGISGGTSLNTAITAMSPLVSGNAAIGSVTVTALPSLAAGTSAIGSITNTGFGITGSLPSGSNAIGTVAVTALPALPTGSNAIGTVGVTALPALPAGSNIVGNFRVDQTTQGTTNGVVVNSSVLPAGAATETGHLASIDAKNPALGAAAKAGSVPVNIASDQTVPVADSSVVTAINNTSVQTGAAGTPASAVLSVQGVSGGTALPVSMSSNPGNVAQTGTLTAAGGTVIVNLNGMHAVGLQISGIGSNSINMLGSQDGGATYPVQVTARPRKPLSSTVAPVTVITVNGNYDVGEGGLDHLELQAAAGWSGTATVTLVQTDAYASLGVHNGTLDPLTAQLTVGTSLVTTSAGLPVVNTVGGTVISTTNPLPSSSVVAGAAVSASNPLPTSGVGVTKLHSSALEACHVFTKPTTGAGLRTVNVTAASSSAVFLFIVEGTAPPSAGSVATTLLDQFFIGSNGTFINGSYSYGVNPLLTVTGSNNFVACLSTTAPPTYTATGAIGWFTAQVL